MITASIIVAVWLGLMVWLAGLSRRTALIYAVSASIVLAAATIWPQWLPDRSTFNVGLLGKPVAVILIGLVIAGAFVIEGVLRWLRRHRDDGQA